MCFGQADIYRVPGEDPLKKKFFINKRMMMVEAGVKPHRRIFIVALCTAALCGCQRELALTPETAVCRVADAVLDQTRFTLSDPQHAKVYRNASDAPPGAMLALTSPYNDWRYWNGVLHLALMELGSATGDDSYIRFVDNNIRFAFDNRAHFQRQYHGENKWNFPFGQFFIMEELDDCGAMGASAIEVCKRDPQERYRAYIEKAAEHIASVQPRLQDGTLVRAFPVKWTIWADDLYMGLSFLARYAEWKEGSFFDDAALQVIRFHHYLFDETKGLMHHCWYSDTGEPGVAFWGRANGWALLAQIDLLERIPLHHSRRDTLMALFQRHVQGIARCQGPDGLWHQLLDKEDSYPETSCSAMFTYAIARGVDRGFLHTRFSAVAEAGWRGVVSRIRRDGKIEGVCTGTGVYDDLRSYYLRPAPLNDIHGTGAVILAGTEMMTRSRNKE